MNFSFSGRHMDIGESLTNKAKEACVALATKYGTEFLDANIVMTKDGYRFCCDISVKTAIGNSYHATNEADDPKVSFDITLQKIDLQMQKKKKTCRGSCKDIVPPDITPKIEDAPIIIAEIMEDLPLISVSDAANRLNDKNKLIVFENISNNSVNVVYKREDGNIGWIDYKKWVDYKNK